MAILTVYDNSGNAIPIPAIRGPKGDTGNSGANGVDGQDGKSAYELAVDDGYSGTETQWLASLKGDSAYQIAIDNGYSGTEAQWLASLKGDKGETGDPTILGAISSENTTAPPSGAAVAAALETLEEAIANAAPNLTPDNYIEITEETINEGTEQEETLNKIRTIIGNIERREEHIYDNIVIETYESTNSVVHTIPVTNSIDDYAQDKICIKSENFDTGFQYLSSVSANELCNLSFQTPVTINNNYNIMPQFSITLSNGTFTDPPKLYLQETSNDELIEYELTVDTSAWTIPTLAENNSTVSQYVNIINQYGTSTWTYGNDVTLLCASYNVANISDAHDLCCISYAKRTDSSLDVSGYNTSLSKIDSNDIAFYVVIYVYPSYGMGMSFFDIWSDDISSYTTAQIKLESTTYYLPFNTTTTYADAQNTDNALSITDNTKPAFIAEFLDENSIQLICSESLKYEPIEIILSKVGKIQWPGNTIRVGPHLEVRNNKIDFPYGRELIKFNRTDGFSCTDTGNYSSSNNYTRFSPYYYNNYPVFTSFIPTENQKSAIQLKCGNIFTYQDTIVWRKSADNSYLMAFINISEEDINYNLSHNSLSYEEAKDKTKISFQVSYDITNARINRAKWIIPGNFNNQQLTLNVNVGEWAYGIKKIPADLIEMQEIETTTTISDGSTAIPTAGAVYTAIENGGKVKTVNNQQPDSNGDINIAIPTVPTIRNTITDFSSETTTTTSPSSVYNYITNYVPTQINNQSTFTSNARGLVPSGGTSTKVLAGDATWKNNIFSGDSNSYNIIVTNSDPGQTSATNTIWFVY